MTQSTGKWVGSSHSHRSQRPAVAGLLAALTLAGATAVAQSSVPAVTGDARVDKLLSQMTLEEKTALIRGASEDPATNQGQAGYLAGVPRLGIPPIRTVGRPPIHPSRLASHSQTATMSR